MTKTKVADSANVEKAEKVDIILAKVEAYKDSFLEAKDFLINSNAAGKKLSHKKVHKLFEIANEKKEEILSSIAKLKKADNQTKFTKVRDAIEEKSHIPGIEKWVYMELRAGMLNLKNNES